MKAKIILILFTILFGAMLFYCDGGGSDKDGAAKDPLAEETDDIDETDETNGNAVCDNDALTTVSPVGTVYFQEDFSLFPDRMTVYEKGSSEYTWSHLSCGDTAPAAGIFARSSTGPQADDEWLISPAINLCSAGCVQIGFDEMIRYATSIDGECGVFFSIDYDGSGDPSLAHWTKLTPAVRDDNGANFVYTKAVADLSQAKGNISVHVAFRYVSGALSAASWEIDNVKISEVSSIATGNPPASQKPEQTTLMPYYSDLDLTLADNEFKSALRTILKKNKKTLSYSDLWDAYATTDFRKNDAGTETIVWDMYSDNPDGNEPYEFVYSVNQCSSTPGSEGGCYNREHSWPKSWFDDESPMYTDLFHVVPADSYVNTRRSNYPYGEVASASWQSENGAKLGSSATAGYSGTVFEPIDEYKGDFARIYFYMATCYYGEMPAGHGSGMTNGSDILAWAETMLRRWHQNDPVSDKELKRNDAVFSIQNNRNPFVDYPQWVQKISDF